jgi:hypothetical protein
MGKRGVTRPMAEMPGNHKEQNKDDKSGHEDEHKKMDMGMEQRQEMLHMHHMQKVDV